MSDKAILLLCGVLALVIFAAAGVLAVFNRNKLTLVVRILGAGTFLILVALIYPSYTIDGQPYAIGLALVQSMCAMLLNANASELVAKFDGYTVSFIGAYKGVLLAMLIIAPLFTVGITLSFFSDKLNRVLYRIRSAFRPSYLLSEINERTLCVAEDIARKNKKAVIVFAVGADNGETDARSLDRIKAIGACVIGDDIVHIAHSTKHERNYYMLCADGSANLDAGLRLYQKYNGKPTSGVNMWLYTKDEISEVIFDHLYETFNVRLINEESLIARRLVTDYPLYNAVQDGKLSVLVVGGGKIGVEIIRWVTACTCLGDDVQAELNVIDRSADLIKGTFEKASPGLIDKWNIRFHGADVGTANFTGILKSIKPTYIVLALGNENLNIETAIYIRRIYKFTGDLPHIHCLADHKSIEKQILPNLCVTYWDYDKETARYTSELVCSFDIKPFGSYEDIYSDLRIGATYLDCLAVAHNAFYRGITEIDERYTPDLLRDLYNQVIFFKDYSDGFAVSVSYKLHLMGLELIDDGEGDLTLLESRLKQSMPCLRAHEAKRHEAYMRGSGWTDMPAEEVEGTQVGDKLGKRNARLDNTQIEALVKKTGRNFEQEDDQVIASLPTVIRLANALYGKRYSAREITKK